jgi:hypothetical protein
MAVLYLLLGGAAGESAEEEDSTDKDRV